MQTTNLASYRLGAKRMRVKAVQQGTQPQREQASQESSVPHLLADLASVLCAHGKTMPHAMPSSYHSERPSAATLIDLMDALRSVLFPGYFGASDLCDESLRFHVGTCLDRVLRRLPEQIARGFSLAGRLQSEQEKDAVEITRRFLAKLPELQAVLATDVKAAFEGDPAATCPEETIFCYPGLRAVTYYRLAHELYAEGVPLIPRIITEHAHSLTGIDIHPGASIGDHFFIDHGTGVVLGETCVVGKGVRIYQGVTLGARSFPKDQHGNPLKGIPRHPVIEDNVVIYAGATILGRITIGRNSVIGGGVWLTHSVPPGTVLTQATERREEPDGTVSDQ